MTGDRIQINGCQGLGGEGIGSGCLMGIVFPFRDDENVLELGSDNAYQLVNNKHIPIVDTGMEAEHRRKRE